MAQRTLYEVLMLHPSATPEVVTAVYRQLAKQHHPDHAQSGDESLMAQINEAHTILIDPVKRARYDAAIGLDSSTPEAAPSAPAQPSAPGAKNLKYDGGSWSVRGPSEPAPAQSAYGEAGEPPRYPVARGSVISFGRYRGWSIGQLAAHDRNYLEWLSRTMVGRAYAAELQTFLNSASP